MRSTNGNFDVFNSLFDIYMVFTKKKVNFFFKPNHNNVKDNEGVFVKEYLDQSIVIRTYR